MFNFFQKKKNVFIRDIEMNKFESELSVKYIAS